VYLLWTLKVGHIGPVSTVMMWETSLESAPMSETVMPRSRVAGQMPVG